MGKFIVVKENRIILKLFQVLFFNQLQIENDFFYSELGDMLNSSIVHITLYTSAMVSTNSVY
jgi:hypothetical protein